MAMATTTMASVPAGVGRLEAPRWVHVRLPRGAMFGEPGNAARQRAVLEAAPVAWRDRQVTEGP